METTLFKSIARKIPLNLRVGCASTYPLGNCSIIPYDNNKYLCAAREFYYFLRRGYYEHPWGSYTNVGMHFCFLDNDFFPIVDNHKLIAKITGMETRDVAFEDPRLFKWKGHFLLSCSAINPKMQDAYRRVAIQVFHLDFSKKNMIGLHGIFNSRKYISDKTCEKNWLAVQDKIGDMVQLIGKNGINVVNILNKTTQIIRSKIELPSNIRGNTPLIRLDNGKYICIVHWRSDIDSMDYYHNFVLFDSNLQIEFISKSFKFDNVFPTEFCSSMFNLIDSSKIGITVCENDCF